AIAIGSTPVCSFPGFAVVRSHKMHGRIWHPVDRLQSPGSARTEFSRSERQHRHKRTAVTFVVRDIHRSRVSGRDDEGVIYLDFLRSEVHGPVDMVFSLFESPASRKRLDLAAPVLYGESAAFDDVVCMAWMEMPLQGFAGSDEELPDG